MENKEIPEFDLPELDAANESTPENKRRVHISDDVCTTCEG